MTNSARHLVIRASAGTGKTYQLTNRYLAQLLEESATDQILAATFTRKAAGEILERVLVRLAEAAGSGKAAAELASQLGRPELMPADFRECLVRFLRDLHRLRVGTLDSFFAKLATNFTLELGLPPGWQLVDERTDQHIRELAIANILHVGRTADFARLANLLSKGTAARSVSGLIRETVREFYDLYRQTDAAAWQQFPALQRLTNEQLEAAIDALEAADLPQDNRFEKSRTNEVEAARTGDWVGFIKDGIAAKVLQGETKYNRKPIPDGLIAIYQRLLDHVRAVMVQELAHQTLATWQLLDRFDAEYQKLKREHRALRFDDVTHRLQELIAGQSTQDLSYRLDGHIAHMLLDEFQDTSPAQWDVLRPFASRITSAEPPSSFFCVGDVKQAIYGWRGGVAEIFDALSDHLAGLENTQLAESFRSSPPVIDTVNRLFQGLTRHAELNDTESLTVRRWTEAFPLHSTAKRELQGYACVIAAAASESEDGKTIDDILPSTADRVAAILRDAPDASVGVLVRTNAEIASLMNLLRDRHIAASEEGGNPITDSAAVLIVLSLLTLIDHPGDTVCRFHVATSPLGESLGFTDHTDDAAAASLAAQVREALIDDGYGPVLERYAAALTPACTDRDRMRLSQLIELGYRFDVEATLRPMDFVDFVQQERFLNPSTDLVRVMTIHAAKGLQFDVVVAPLTERRLAGQPPRFIAGRQGPSGPISKVCLYRNREIQKLLPVEWQQAFDAAATREVHETLCRLYVTVTRPVHALHVLVPASTKSEKKLPCTAAGLVRAALSHGQAVLPDELLYETGDRNWWQRSSGRSAPSDHPEHVEPSSQQGASIRVRLAPITKARKRRLTRVAPSRHVSRQPVRVSNVLQRRNVDSLRRGTLLHAWFEQITWLEDGLPEQDRMQQIASNHGFPSDEYVMMLDRFSKMLQEEQLLRLLSREGYQSTDLLPFSIEVREILRAADVTCEVRREFPVALRKENEVLSGAIDRVVLFRRDQRIVAADVIDFKTDAVSPERPLEWTQRVESYQQQLEAYRQAIGRIFRLPSDRIAARIVFVEPQVVVTLEAGVPDNGAGEHC